MVDETDSRASPPSEPHCSASAVRHQETKPGLLAVAATVAWPIRDGYTLRIDGLLRHMSEDWDITLVALHRRDADDSGLRPPVRFESVLKRNLEDFAPSVAEVRDLRATVRRLVQGERFSRTLVWCGAESVVLGSVPLPIVLDRIDCATLASWRSFKRTRGALRRGRELRALQENAINERRLVRGVAATIAVGADDARVLRILGGRQTVHSIPNGVSLPEFRALGKHPHPTVVFSGMMAFPPNIDAAVSFAKQVWPTVRSAVPDARFRIVGREPAPEVLALRTDSSIDVIGEVPDMSEELGRSWIGVAPMRSGSGIKNKILEAWAVGVPVIMTAMAANGLGADPAISAMVRDRPRDLAELIIRFLHDRDECARMSRAVRKLAEERSWECAAREVSRILRAQTGAVETAPGTGK
jgi:glycosyltransferase involved in cell wall biosynthesis